MSISPTTGESIFFASFLFLFLLYLPLPFIGNKVLFWIHDKTSRMRYGWVIYVSFLILIASFILLAAPVPEALDPVVLLLCVLNGGLPFLIVQRYKAIASHTPEKWCISYYVIFIGILLFNIYMLAARLSSLLF